MSIFLYRLGGAIGRHRALVVAIWLLALTALVGGASALGDHYDDSFSIPGTQSQQGQEILAERFGQAGANGTVLFTARHGKITDSQNADAVASLSKKIDAVPHVSFSDPLKATSPLLNAGHTASLSQLRFAAKVPSEHTLDAVQQAAHTTASSPIVSHVGGDAYKTTSEPSKVPELLGLLVSFLILALTFGSLIAAGMPILTALIGVGATLTGVMLVSRIITVSSTAPTLAEMLGLAVGIDYALFILSRHRGQLAEGVAVVESMQRALATAGSAVVFAGATVIIALAGLSVAGIPVLTVMGVGAAAAVAVAVCVALTLLPAIALLLGERLRPKARRRRLLRRRRPRAPRPGLAARWIRVVTRWPALTIVAVVALLGLATLPATHLELALPDNSTAPTSTPQRQTYDAVTREFGEGYNAPLAVLADVITSSDPKDTVSKLAGAVAKLPGVVAVPQQTPDKGGDTGLIQVIPKAGQTAPSTAALVHEIRSQAPTLEKKYGVSDIMVTGSTAVNIDASDRLGGALLPFGCIVIGLSLVLLMIVFRSVAVPLKATLGYLLSVGTALGAVVAVFELGWADALVPGLSDAPVVSFLPIFVMGVLFGLAMDYEMFLVSAMREHFVESGDARAAVGDGFRASARVVTAAALIMTSVFVAFIPAGTATIRQIAFGLAVGVFVDAFVVRMSLVPAVLMLLGRRAWWLPARLDRALPSVDVEGAALHRKVAFDDHQARHGETAVLARGLVLGDGTRLDVEARPGAVTEVVVAPAQVVAAARMLSARERAGDGELVVAGLLLPEQREEVARRTALIELDRIDPGASTVRDRIAERAHVSALGAGRRRDLAARMLALTEELVAAAAGPARPPGGTGALGPAIEAAAAQAAMASVCGCTVFVLAGADRLPSETRAHATELAAELARRGGGVLTVVGAPTPRPVVAAVDGASRSRATESEDAR